MSDACSFSLHIFSRCSFFLSICLLLLGLYIGYLYCFLQISIQKQKCEKTWKFSSKSFTNRTKSKKWKELSIVNYSTAKDGVKALYTTLLVALYLIKTNENHFLFIFYANISENFNQNKFTRWEESTKFGRILCEKSIKNSSLLVMKICFPKLFLNPQKERYEWNYTRVKVSLFHCQVHKIYLTPIPQPNDQIKGKREKKRNVISKYPPAIFTYVRFSLHSTPCHASHS